MGFDDEVIREFKKEMLNHFTPQGRKLNRYRKTIMSVAKRIYTPRKIYVDA
jgi:hypothetical protein